MALRVARWKARRLPCGSHARLDDLAGGLRATGRRRLYQKTLKGTQDEGGSPPTYSARLQRRAECTPTGTTQTSAPKLARARAGNWALLLGGFATDATGVGQRRSGPLFSILEP